MFARAWITFGVGPETLYRLKDLYFENMTAFSLFQEPTFESKAQSITSSLHLHALLAAMFSYSARYMTLENRGAQGRDMENYESPAPTSEHFFDLAERFVDEALRKCGDETPPLCLLQALVLTTFQQLTRGVRGSAWRSLGACVRIAYELNLHLVDSEDSSRQNPATAADKIRWCNDEERRRVWWAIWEMDTFASTVRRVPTAIDWSQNETYLPADDDMWFQGNPQQSCFLEKNPIDRWKALQNSGNQSPKAWFIVINSLMREAQILSSPRGVFRSSTRGFSGRASKYISERLGAISNALRCFTLALPQSLKYRNQYLGFDAKEPGQAIGLRHMHSSVYSIHMMTQLAKFMINHYHVFGTASRAPVESACQNMADCPSAAQCQSDNIALEQYFEAADDILTILNRSCEEHIRYVNPFLASTIWLAAAAQLVHKYFGKPGESANLAKSKFEVLFLHYKQFVAYWEISTALQQNLDSLEARLERFCLARMQMMNNNSNDQTTSANRAGEHLFSNTHGSSNLDYEHARSLQQSHTNAILASDRNLFADFDSQDLSYASHVPTASSRSPFPRFRHPHSVSLPTNTLSICPNGSGRCLCHAQTCADPYSATIPSLTHTQSQHQLVASAGNSSTNDSLTTTGTPAYGDGNANGSMIGGEHDSSDMVNGQDFTIGLGLTEAELQGYLDQLLSGTYVG